MSHNVVTVVLLLLTLNFLTLRFKNSLDTGSQSNEHYSMHNGLRCISAVHGRTRYNSNFSAQLRIILSVIALFPLYSFIFYNIISYTSKIDYFFSKKTIFHCLSATFSDRNI